jgi:hypothetical protein
MWIEAIQKEVERFDAFHIFKKADLVGHAMKTKFVFTVTFKSDYTLKYKARLVVCEYSQIIGDRLPQNLCSYRTDEYCASAVVLCWLGLAQIECFRCDCVP